MYVGFYIYIKIYSHNCSQEVIWGKQSTNVECQQNRRKLSLGIVDEDDERKQD